MFPKKTRLAACLLTFLLFAVPVAPAANDFKAPFPEDGPRLGGAPRCFGANPDAPAYRNFMSGEPAGATLASSSSWPLTVRIGVVRVGFQADSNPKTTGNGTWGDIPFFTFNGQGQLVVDPSVDSRSKAYIQRNVLFAAQYYQEVSQGKVILVVPDTLTDISEIYTLPHEMAEYGRDDNYSLRLCNLAQDALKAADSEMDYSKYDVIFVFHAGCGQHTDYVPDSPDDINPASLNRYLLKAIVGQDDESYQGIVTNDHYPDGRPFFATNVQIYPETAIQDYGNPGNPGAELRGILGVMVNKLGNYFGLPDLYDTRVGTRPTIGFFALMATGFFNAYCRIPCHPMAWSKVYLGWEEPTVVTGDWENLVLKSAELWGQGIRIIKVPISSTEYFLVENRTRDENFNGRFDFDERGENFFPDVMVDDYQLDDGSFAEFDWGLPSTFGLKQTEITPEQNALIGSGVLIWHIDEEVIRRNMSEGLTVNSVNTEPNHLGVALEEADGLEHLLEPYPASIDPGYGSPFDVFGGAVPGIKSLDLGNLNLLFGVYTNPNTISYTGLPSNLEIGGFRSVTVQPGQPVVDTLVALDIRFNVVPEGKYLPHPVQGYPHRLETATVFSSPLAVDLDPASPGVEALQVTDDGRVYLAKSTGQGAFVAQASDSVHSSPAVGDITGDGLPEVVMAAADGSLWAWTLNTVTALTVVPGWPVIAPGTFSSFPALADLDGDGALEVVIGNRNGATGSQLFALKGNGSHLSGFPVNLENEVASGAAFLRTGPGAVEAVYVGTVDGILYGFGPDGSLIFKRTLGSPVLASPVVGRMGLPGQSEDFRVAVFTANGQIWLFDTRGEPVPGWPVTTGGRCLAGGALGDINGDGLNELVVPVDFPDTSLVLKGLEYTHSGWKVESRGGVFSAPGQHRLFAFRYNGTPLVGFPIHVNAPLVSRELRYLSAPSLADLTGDGAQEIILATGGRLALAWSGDGQSVPVDRFILGSGALGCPVPADLDGDGVLDLLCSDGEGYLYGYTTGAAGTEVQWAGLGGNPTRSGLTLRTQTHPGAPGTGALLPDSLCYIYPNPVRGGLAHIVYSLGRTGVRRVTVDVFTVSGEAVKHFEGGTEAAAGLANEVIWDTTPAASGVYLVLIKVEPSEGKAVRVIKKVAVIK